MILEGSRYENAKVVRVVMTDGTYRWAVLTERWFSMQEVSYRYRTAAAYDRFDRLAAIEYGDPQLWWVIAKANPEIFYPDDIPVGAVIRIPDASLG